MVRTKAGNSAASRKAVVAKAPRKNLVPVRSPSSSTSSSSKRKGKAGGTGGNPLKLWPVPKGQKGLQSFLGGTGSSSGSNGGDDDAGCSSSSMDAQEGTSTAVMETVEETPVSRSPSPSPSPSLSEDNTTTAEQLSFLDDITQINSDSDD